MKEITNKDDVCRAIAAVMRTLDTGITVTGVQNAGNLSGSFMILQEVLNYLAECNIEPAKKPEVPDSEK